MALRGLGSERHVEMATSDRAATDVDSWNVRKF